MNPRPYIAALVSSMLLFAAPAYAQGTKASALGLDIEAIVGEEAISTYDVNSRIKFVITTTSLSNTDEVRRGIRPQIIRAIIDEKLQLKSAADNKITISDEEVARAVASIEKQRNMPEGAIAKMLAQGGVPYDTFTQQVRAQLAWSALVARKIRPQIKISDEEIQLAHIKLPKPKVKQELKIAALVLPVDKAREPQVKQLAARLAGEIRGGASFDEVYRQFSGIGGKPEAFWVKPEQLDPAISKALANAASGMISAPIRTNDSYTIVKVYDTRSLEKEAPKEIEVQLKEILLKLKEDASPKEADVLLQIGEEVAKNPGTCKEEGIAGVDDLKDFDIDVKLTRTRVSQLAPAVRIIADNLNVGDISTPFASSEGIRLYMLCDKREASDIVEDKDQLANLLFQQKIALEAEKYMRNLRREVFIEIRG